jgi:hypothetical protein
LINGCNELLEFGCYLVSKAHRTENRNPSLPGNRNEGIQYLLLLLSIVVVPSETNRKMALASIFSGAS